MEWYYAKDGQQHGPISEADLIKLALSGSLRSSDLIWQSAFGDTWQSAGAQQFLRDAIPAWSGVGVSVPPLPHRNTHNRDLMRMARESLAGNWGLGVVVALLVALIPVAINLIPFLGSIIALLITGPLMLGFCIVFLCLVRKQDTRVGQLFDGFQRFSAALGAYILMGIFIFLWSLLLIIPGIIATLSYAMTYFIIADNPGIGALEAIRRSKAMMSGHKWKLFCLWCRFIGWFLLVMLTFGIASLWITPYFQASLAHFYEDIRE